MGKRAGLGSVAAEAVGTDAANLMISVVGKGDIVPPVTFNTDGSTLYRGAHVSGVGSTAPVNIIDLWGPRISTYERFHYLLPSEKQCTSASSRRRGMQARARWK